MREDCYTGVTHIVCITHIMGHVTPSTTTSLQLIVQETSLYSTIIYLL